MRKAFPRRLTCGVGAVMALCWLTLAGFTSSAQAAGQHSALAAASGSPKIDLSVGTGPPGTPVTITGSGFPPSEIVALYIDVAGPYLSFPGPQADAQGGFRVDIKMPDKNYDTTGRVNPAIAGPHNICGDTGYPGNSQPVAVKACAQFIVLAVPSPSPTPTTAPAPSSAAGPPVASVIGVFVILLILAAGLFLLLRRSK